MVITTLRSICRAKNLNQSDVARIAGVSRQAVSTWFKAAESGSANIQTRHLMALSEGLGVPAQVLLEPLPGLTREERARWRTTLLWDNLYPDLDAFVLGLARGEDRALARLVDRVGLYRAASIAGGAVWKRFSAYRRHLHPARRSGLERLWTARQSRASS
jgi:transcriptional regulator with XRE-family HTH domain